MANTIHASYLFLLVYYSISNQFIFSKANPFLGTGFKIQQAGSNELGFIVSISLKNHVNLPYRTRIEDRHECGGSLITKMHVLTSAHCKCSDYKLRDYTVKVGHNLTNPMGEYDIATWHTYKKGCCPLFRQGYRCNDIAVIKLSEAVDQNIVLPRLNYSPTDRLYDKTAVTAGWGNTNSVHNPIMMLKITVTTISMEECKRNIDNAPKIIRRFNGQLRQPFNLENNTVCSNGNRMPGNESNYVILGKGDSGSPLVIGGNQIIAVNEATAPSEGNNYIQYEQNLHIALLPYKQFIERETRRGERSGCFGKK